MSWKFAAALVLGAVVGYLGAVIHILAQTAALAEAVKAQKKARKSSA